MVYSGECQVGACRGAAVATCVGLVDSKLNLSAEFCVCKKHLQMITSGTIPADADGNVSVRNPKIASREVVH